MAKILVVDDETDICELAERILQREGHLVTIANNGQEGYTVCLREVPDLILTDNDMPGLTGVEMAKKLRAALIPTPIILMTGAATFVGANTELDTLTARGLINGYLFKPFDIQALVRMVNLCLNLP